MYSIFETHIRVWISNFSFLLWRSKRMKHLEQVEWEVLSSFLGAHTRLSGSWFLLRPTGAPSLHPRWPGAQTALSCLARWFCGNGTLVHLVCPLAWAIRCPCIWLNIALCVSVRVFGDDFNIHTDWLSRWSSPLWLNLILSVKDQNRKINTNCWLAPRLEGILPVRLPLNVDAVYPCLWTQAETWDWKCTSASPGSPACWLPILGFVSLQSHTRQ